MKGYSRTSLIAFSVVAIVALIAVIFVLKGGMTGSATKIFSTKCFDFCRDKMCNKISPDDSGRLYPCLNDCLNQCWAEYTVAENLSGNL